MRSTSVVLEQIMVMKNKLRANQKIKTLSGLVGLTFVFINACGAPKLEQGSRSESRSQHLATSLADGGQITGVVRDSVTGGPLVQAFVGIKATASSKSYIARLRTDSNGAYQSPFLIQAIYYLDIILEGKIEIRGQPITLVLGNTVQENVALSEPVCDQCFRITTSWGGEKPNAVRDVDSYLRTPDNFVVYYGAHDSGDAFLDRDDRDWIGPETVTISGDLTGAFTYFVNNFSDRAGTTFLGNSEVITKVYKGARELRTYRVPQGEGINYVMFRIENGEIRDINQFSMIDPFEIR